MSKGKTKVRGREGMNEGKRKRETEGERQRERKSVSE